MNALLGTGTLVDGAALLTLLWRLALDLIVATLIIRQVYFRRYRNREMLFISFLFNVVTFCLCMVLSKLSTGMAFGLALFGIFGVLRFRTEQIRSRDLTYLFIAIGVGIINAVAATEMSLAELLVVNGVIAGLAALLELGPSANERSTLMLYDRIELLSPGSETRLAEDIATRTGLQVLRVDVLQVDLLRDAAELSVIHRPGAPAAPPGLLPLTK